MEEGHPLSPQSGRPPSPARAPCQQASRDFKIKMVLVRLLWSMDELPITSTPFLRRTEPG